MLSHHESVWAHDPRFGTIPSSNCRYQDQVPDQNSQAFPPSAPRRKAHLVLSSVLSSRPSIIAYRLDASNYVPLPKIAIQGRDLPGDMMSASKTPELLAKLTTDRGCNAASWRGCRSTSWPHAAIPCVGTASLSAHHKTTVL